MKKYMIAAIVVIVSMFAVGAHASSDSDAWSVKDKAELTEGVSLGYEGVVGVKPPTQFLDCLVEETMQAFTPAEFLGMSEDEEARFGVKVALKCMPLFPRVIGLEA